MRKQFSGINDYLSEFHQDTGRTLVVGSHVYDKKPIDRRDLYRDAVGVDMKAGNGVDFCHNLEDRLPPEIGTFDHVDCVSTMEHCSRPWKMAETILAVMNPGATILLSVPFSWRVHGYPSDYYRFTIEAFDVLYPGIDWKSKGYFTAGQFRKIANRVDIDGKKYIERCEAIGYGVLNLWGEQ